jgi:hypothetical protein
VTRCRFAEYFRALGEPELGSLLICETDFDIASAGEGEVGLERAQTIMRGAPSCTFRYKFAPRQESLQHRRTASAMFASWSGLPRFDLCDPTEASYHLEPF